MTRYKGFDNILKDLKERLFNLDYVEDIYLFGSVAKGKVHENSDLDLLIIGYRKKTIDVLVELDKICENNYVDVDGFRLALKNNSLFLKDLSTYAIDLKEMG